MDRALLIREAIVARLKVSAGVTALVPAASIHGERVPAVTAPMVYLSDPTLTPEKMACWSGERSTFSVHGYVPGVSNDGAAILGGALKRELDEQALALEGGTTADLVWTGGRIIKDRDEPDLWHVIADFEAV